jgi:hypothetical protein
LINTHHPPAPSSRIGRKGRKILPFWGGVPPQNGLKNVSPALDPLRVPEGAGGGGQGVGDEFANSIINSW